MPQFSHDLLPVSPTKPTMRVMNNSDDNYISVLLEEIREQSEVVLEAVGEMQEQVRQDTRH